MHWPIKFSSDETQILYWCMYVNIIRFFYSFVSAKLFVKDSKKNMFPQHCCLLWIALKEVKTHFESNNMLIFFLRLKISLNPIAGLIKLYPKDHVEHQDTQGWLKRLLKNSNRCLIAVSRPGQTSVTLLFTSENEKNVGWRCRWCFMEIKPRSPPCNMMG